TVNGQVMQDAFTGEMIFDVATLVSDLSRGMTLLPGTVILTGTPSGVGMARTPPVWLKHGDVVEITIEKLGSIRSRVGFEGSARRSTAGPRGVVDQAHRPEPRGDQGAPRPSGDQRHERGSVSHDRVFGLQSPRGEDAVHRRLRFLGRAQPGGGA